MQSFTDTTCNQNTQINDMLDGAETIRKLMDSRRELMQQQQRADEIKSALCDKIRAEKMKVPGLQQKIKMLEDSDPELFNYIRKLELIQGGIWCQNCNQVKTVGGRPNQAVCAETQQPSDMVQLREDYRALEKEFECLLNRLNTIRTEYNAKIQQSISIANELENQLQQMCKRACELGACLDKEPCTLGSKVQSAPKVQNIQNTPKVQNMQNTPLELLFKKEDLPPKPCFSLDKIAEEKISAMDVDELLGD